MKKAIIIILTIVLAAGIFASCGDPAKTVVATVNGENIYKSEADVIVGLNIVESFNYYNQMYSQFGMDQMSMEDFKNDEESISGIKTSALDEIVKWKATISNAKKQGAALLSEQETEEARTEAQTNIDSLRDSFRTSVEAEKVENPTINVEKRVNYLFDQEMKNYGFTEQAFVEFQALQKEYLAARDYIAGLKEITDEEYGNYLDEQIKSQKESYEADPTSLSGAGTVYYYPEGSMYVKHILVKLEDEVVSEIQAIEDEAEQKKLLETKLPAIKSRADEVYAKTATGNFDELIKTYNDDPGMAEGSTYGETGYFIYPGTQDWMPEFTEAALKLKLNEISEPVATTYGYHIIKCIKIPQTLKLNNLTADQKKEIEDALKEKYIDETITKWQEETDIVKYPERLGIKQATQESTEPESTPEESVTTESPQS